MSRVGSAPVHVVVDTNVFLHFQPLAQFPWDKLFGGPVTVVVCAQVVRELDTHKDEANSRAKRDRARSALRLVEQAGTAPLVLSPALTVQVHPFAPHRDAFVGGLSESDADDQIVATAVALRNEGGGRRVVLLSDDVGPRIKARAVGIEPLEPPEALRLPDAEDARDAEIRRLTKRLKSIEHTVPCPVLLFANKSQSLAVSPPDRDFLGKEPEPPEQVQRAVQPIRQPDHAEVAAEEERTDELMKESGIAVALARMATQMAKLLAPTPEQVATFNREVQDFHAAYPDAYAEWQAFRAAMHEILVFNVVLTNEGTAPVQGLDVYLCVAQKHRDKFSIVQPEALPRPPDMPLRPTINPLGGVIDPMRFGIATVEGEPGPRELDGAPYRENYWGVIHYAPSSRFVDYDEDGAHIRFGDHRLKHGFTLTYGPFAVRRMDPQARGCTLDYVIHADNLPKPVTGCLNLRIVVEGDHAS